MGKKKKTTHYSGIGGQAVLEGVMMKNKDDYAVAIRKPNGEIEVEVDVYRGILHDSALEAEETKLDKALNKVSGGRAEKILMGVTTVASIVIAIAVFMLLPYFLSTLLVQYIRNDSLLAIIEGIIRILIFVIYIVAISLMKDIHRLYQYHGAEHKCINCVENGRPLTIHNVMRSSRIHKRCGTSFMFLVVFVSIILFFFIRVQNPALRVVLRIALVPVIAGISYEIIRLAGRSDNIFVKIISAPGMWLQKLTTKEPDREMAEVAIRSVEAVFDWKSYLKDEFGYEVDDSWLQDEPGEEE